jgi:hypothetical protein
METKLAVRESFVTATRSQMEKLFLQGHDDHTVSRQMGLPALSVAYFRQEIHTRWQAESTTPTILHLGAVKRLESCLREAWVAYNTATLGFTVQSTTESVVLDGVSVVTGKKMSKKARTDANRWMNTILQIQKELRDLQGVTPPEHTVVEHIDRETPRDALLAKLSSLRVVNEDVDAVDVD